MQTLTEIGYSIYHHNHTTLIYKPPLDPGHIPADGPIGRPTTLKGRRQLHFLEPDLIVRELVHGGLLAGLTRDYFLSPARSLREIKVSHYLARHGLLTPEVMGLRIVRKSLFLHITVITRLVPQATDLIAYLATARENAHQLFEQAGHLVRRMHDLNVYHADLHLKNFLLDKALDMWLLDLDKAWRVPVLPPLAASMNIRRFLRSCRKWSAQGRIILPEDYVERFRQGYSNP